MSESRPGDEIIPTDVLRELSNPLRRRFLRVPPLHMGDDTTGGRVMKLDISEAAFQSVVTDYAELVGWTWCHFRPARTDKGYRTAMSGRKGFPDLVFAHSGRVLFVELKTQRGVVSADQRHWLDQLGEHARLWRPADWNSGEIIRTLRHYWRDPITGLPSGPSSREPRSRGGSQQRRASSTGR